MRTVNPLTAVRNLGILAHVDAGKTTVTERILYLTGATHKRGEVHDGTTVTDFDPQERDRGITIFAAAVSCDWDGHRLNLIDTPGHVDFSDEVERSLRVLDGAVAVFDAVAGVEPQSESVWRRADRHGVPRIAFVNKLDRAGADLDAAVGSLRERLHTVPLVVQLPIGREDGFTGVVDLLRMRALVWADGHGTYAEGPVPEDLREEALRRRRVLEETVAELHAAAFEEFCERSVLSEATLRSALRDLTLSGDGVVVLCGSAYRNRGIEPLLEAVVDYLPSPLDVPAVRQAVDPAAPFAALVFKVNVTATGRLTYLRVYEGTIRKGTPCWTRAPDAPSGSAGSCGCRPTGTSTSTPRSPGTSSRWSGSSPPPRARPCAPRGHPWSSNRRPWPSPSSSSRSRPPATPTPTAWPWPWPGWPRRTPRWPCGPTPRRGRPSCPAWANCTWR